MMNGFENSVFLLILGVIQAVGLISAALARLSEGSGRQAASQRLFLACLALVGGCTVVSLVLGPGYWLTSGTTLSLMVLAATCDFNYAGRTETAS
ncbi:MAG: hypothetical protein KJZ87_03720 [Thermoguttaceae bacterium]|nr:hypothetical protein [Thermoguttaceae bacterium]